MKIFERDFFTNIHNIKYMHVKCNYSRKFYTRVFLKYFLRCVIVMSMIPIMTIKRKTYKTFKKGKFPGGGNFSGGKFFGGEFFLELYIYESD